MSGKQKRPELRNWLERLVMEGRCGLKWLSESDGTFLIPWCNQKNREWKEKDVELSLEWAKYTGRHRQGDTPDHQAYKARLRCALNKNPDIESIQDGKNIPPKHKGYRFKPRHGNVTQIFDVVTSLHAVTEPAQSVLFERRTSPTEDTENRQQFYVSPQKPTEMPTVKQSDIPDTVKILLHENVNVDDNTRQLLTQTEHANSSLTPTVYSCQSKNVQQFGIGDGNFYDSFIGSPVSGPHQIQQHPSPHDGNPQVPLTAPAAYDIAQPSVLDSSPEYLSYKPAGISNTQQDFVTQPQLHGIVSNAPIHEQRQAPLQAVVEIDIDNMETLSQCLSSLSFGAMLSGSVPSTDSMERYVKPQPEISSSEPQDTDMSSLENNEHLEADSAHSPNPAQRLEPNPKLRIKIYYGNPLLQCGRYDVTKNKCLIWYGVGHPDVAQDQNIHELSLPDVKGNYDLSDKQKKEIAVLLDGMKDDGLLLSFDHDENIFVERRCLSRVFVSDGVTYNTGLARTKPNRPTPPTLVFNFNDFKEELKRHLNQRDIPLPRSHFVLAVGREILCNDPSPLRKQLLHVIVTHGEASRNRQKAENTAIKDTSMLSDPDSGKHGSA